MSKTIVVAGALAQKPYQGGHSWVFLQYLLGFKRLGWDVLFLDRIEADMCVDEDGRPCPLDHSVNMRYFARVMEGFGLQDSHCLIYNGGERFVGLSEADALERVRHAAFLLNVMGYLDHTEILAAAPRLVFLDIDPGFGQMWQDLGLFDVFRGHDEYVTIGENIGQADCAIPTCGLNWITTAQPVVLDQWQQATGHGNGFFTSIASWRGPFAPIDYKGKTYGLRVHEFRKFVELPRLTQWPFQLALDIHPDETRDLALLRENGWSLIEPGLAAADPWIYRDYVRGSKAELMVAKNMYVQSNSGWFSDRSICYMASGRPVLAQDTGLGSLYPAGAGLLTFSSLEEAVRGAEEILSNYSYHSQAARALAEECFDSDKVLTRLLGKLGVA